jgi:hypothetical protein
VGTDEPVVVEVADGAVGRPVWSAVGARPVVDGPERVAVPVGDGDVEVWPPLECARSAPSLEVDVAAGDAVTVDDEEPSP